MPEWIPTERSAKGRLTLRALDAFAADDFEVVNVVELCAAAEVTTGTLYHHFGNKLGLYDVVRTEVERRLLDRLEGALAASPGTTSERVHRALVVGFDYLVASGVGRMVSVPHPDAPVDPLEKWLEGQLATGPVPLAALVLASWRRAVRATVDGVDAAAARLAFERVSFSA